MTMVKIRSIWTCIWLAAVLLLLDDTKFKHRLTDLHLSKLIMTVLPFRDVSKFSSVNTAIRYCKDTEEGMNLLIPCAQGDN